MPDFHEYRDYLYDDFEFRQDDDTGLGVVTGTIVKYGDVATFPWGKERSSKTGCVRGCFHGLDLIRQPDAPVRHTTDRHVTLRRAATSKVKDTANGVEWQ